MLSAQGHSDLEVANARGGDLEVAWDGPGGGTRPFLHRLSISRFGSRSHFADASRSRLRGGGGGHGVAGVGVGASPGGVAYSPYETDVTSTSPVLTYATGRPGMMDRPSLDEKGAAMAQWSVSQGSERRYTPLRLTRPVCLAVLLGGAVFLLGILATVVSVVMLSRHTAGADGPTRTPSLSGLAAANFTDPTGVDRKIVVYQDASAALMASTYDGVSNQWTAINITASVMNASRVAGLDVKPGSPLAVISNGYEICVYYLSSLNRVSEVWSPAEDVWKTGTLGGTLNLAASPKSRLAAVWQMCGDVLGCPDSLLVFYEDIYGLIQGANQTSHNGSSIWQAIPAAISPVATVPGSGLSANAFTDVMAARITGPATTALRVYRFVGTSLYELINGPLTRFGWEIGNRGAVLATGIPMDTPPQIASLTYDPGTEGWTCNMVLYLTANGTIMGHQWNHTAWTVRQVGLGGGPPGSANFTSFAVTQGLRMYGIAGGAIHEYQFSKSSPFNWLYVTTIKVPGGIL